MIKDLLDSLNDSDRRTLMYAFEHGLTQVIKLPDNKFLGVNAKFLEPGSVPTNYC